MKKTLASAIIIASLVAMAPTGFAAANIGNEKGDKKERNENANVQLNYIGEDQSYVVLQVVLSKSDSKSASFRITDGLGEVLHSERFSESNFTRFFKVSPDELKKIELVFDTAGGTQRKLYNLNTKVVSTFKLEEIAIK